MNDDRALIEFAHSFVAAYREAEILKRLLLSADVTSSSEPLRRLDEWLDTWEWFGAIFRCGGYDDIIAVHPPAAKSEPSNVREAKVSMLEAANLWLPHLMTIAEKSNRQSESSTAKYSEAHSALTKLIEVLSLRSGEPEAGA